jgi:hypothetical protein
VLRVVLLLIVLLLLVRFGVLLARHAIAAMRGPQGSPPGAGAAVPLVPCRSCGVMVPLPRALPQRGGDYLCRSCDGR